MAGNFKIRQNIGQLLTSQDTVQWHCENNLNSLQILLKDNTAKYVYVCVEGDGAFISLPKFSKIIYIRYISLLSYTYANYQIHKVICSENYMPETL